jgi:hypothetical protein
MSRRHDLEICLWTDPATCLISEFATQQDFTNSLSTPKSGELRKMYVIEYRIEIETAADEFDTSNRTQFWTQDLDNNISRGRIICRACEAAAQDLLQAVGTITGLPFIPDTYVLEQVCGDTRVLCRLQLSLQFFLQDLWMIQDNMYIRILERVD